MATSSRNWSSNFPAYQIDFTAVASGKHIAASKRKVRWRFGFPNKKALDDGLTGVECRGEEHDVVIIWSITSGKRQVYMDGTEIHFSVSRAGVMQHSWSTRGNHVLKIVAHAAPPVTAHPGFRQYNLLIDGQSFFTMPKAFELGLRGPIPGQARTPGVHSYASGSSPTRGGPGIPAPTNVQQEEEDLRRAINASLEESRQYLESKQPQIADDRSAISVPNVQVTDLMDFGSSAQPTSPAGTAPIPHSQSQYALPPAQYPPAASGPPVLVQSAPYQAVATPPPPHQHRAQPPPQAYQSPPSNALVPSTAPALPYAQAPPPPNYGAMPVSAVAPYNGGQPSVPVPQQTAYTAPPVPPPAPAAVPTGNLFAPPPADPFAPAPVTDPYGLRQVEDPFAPKPPPPPTTSDIHNAILGAYGGPPPPGAVAPATVPGVPQQPTQPQQGVAQVPAIENGSTHTEPAVLTMNNLTDVNSNENVDALSAAMRKLVNIDHIDEPAEGEIKLTMIKEQKETKAKNGRSRGHAPAASGMVGTHATLDHIKSVKPETAKTGEGVMRAPPQLFHPNAAMAGALVVHGQMPQGPPPIQQGFGVGYGPPPPSYGRR